MATILGWILVGVIAIMGVLVIMGFVQFKLRGFKQSALKIGVFG